METKEKNLNIIFNVLFKDLNGSVNPIVNPFYTLEGAVDWIDSHAKRNHLTFKSTIGWEDDNYEIGSFTDFRVIDLSGKTYYYVVYVQNIGK